jgi:DNA repair protein RecO (recombination protein O)
MKPVYARTVTNDSVGNTFMDVFAADPPIVVLPASSPAVRNLLVADSGQESLSTLPGRQSGKTAVRRSKPPEKEHKISAQPGFVLHSYPYKETSLIVDVFSRDYGRIALVAKGAKRPHSKLRGVLQTFQPLTVSWSGKSEIRTLTAAEWVGGLLPLEKSALLCGFYLNELLVKLLARDDPHAALFDHYIAALNQLAHDESAPIVLRKFERALLKETGVATDFAICTSTTKAVDPERTYVVDPEHGPRIARSTDQWPCIAGKTLLDMERQDYTDVITQTQSKMLMRFLLTHHLGGVQLNTRQILIDLMQL